MPKKQSIAGQISKFKQKEINALFKRARSIYIDNYFQISQVQIEKLEPKIESAENLLGKLLIITPRKIGNAPERNKLRRRIKSIFYEEKFYSYPFKTIIFCKIGSTKLSFSDIKEILIAAFKKN